MFPAKRMKVQVEHETYDLDIVLVDDHEPGKILGHPKAMIVMDPVTRRIVAARIVAPNS
jgi:hypothetical protein